jgi:hypothetical protein
MLAWDFPPRENAKGGKGKSTGAAKVEAIGAPPAKKAAAKKGTTRKGVKKATASS